MVEETSGMTGDAKHRRELWQMSASFVRSRVLTTAARLGIADAFGEGERTVEQLATACEADAGSLRRLLRALATMGIVSESQSDRFVLTDLGTGLRKSDAEGAWAEVVFWGDLLAGQWAYLTDCVRSGRDAWAVMAERGGESLWSKDAEAPAIFAAVMGTDAAENRAPFARAWDFSKARVVADLGGGGGSLILAILAEYPNVRGMLVDRRDSIERAAARFASDPLASRCQLLAADLTKSVPPGSDVHLLSAVLHAYPDERAAGILRNCRAVLPADGRVLVIESVLPELFNRVDKEMEDRVMNDLNMLAVTGGKERSAPEWTALLAQAGFEVRGITPVPGALAAIIEAAPRD
jgi:precorrin-6B methylase 2